MNKKLLMLSILVAGIIEAAQNHMVVVTCSYNNKGIFRKNLDSILSQNYDNFHLLYVDDNSYDGTTALVRNYIHQHPLQEKCIFVYNKERKLAMANLYTNIHRCNPRSIIVLVDGDDWFIDENVLSYINEQYQKNDIWLTYGQFIVHPSGEVGWNCPYPKEVIQKSGFRYFSHSASHLRTFYAGLFHKIWIDDMMFQGEFFPMCYDLAIMFPMLEMAHTRFKFIDKPLLIYNDENPINDYKVDKKLQRKYDLILRARTVYRPLENLFSSESA